MDYLSELKKEICFDKKCKDKIFPYLMYLGYKDHYNDPVTLSRAYAIESLFVNHKKKVFKNDLILGSLTGLCDFEYEINPALWEKSVQITNSYGQRVFAQNADHYAPDHAAFLADGIGGILEKIHDYMNVYSGQCEKTTLLKSMEISMTAFGTMIAQYGVAARKLAYTLPEQERAQLLISADICEKISTGRPETFREALQLVWCLYIAFFYQGRYAMAFGRMDQYLYPYYIQDIEKGIITREFAKSLIACTLYKIGENRYFSMDDVVNIAIGGVKKDGSDAVNELSYIILEAVRDCGIEGPNLSARLHSGISDKFLDECLKVIGTGIGYPALMNDEINIPALLQCGYELEDCRNYCMVGCIENFLPGQQPPWSDSFFNAPMYLELAINDGYSWQLDAQLGPHTGTPSQISSMAEFVERFHLQLEVGIAESYALFRNENDRLNKKNYEQPFLSALSHTCIERGLDINNGGMKYPAVHGIGGVGIATIADSLAAIEQLVFVEKKVTLTELRDALIADFKGYEELHQALLNAPKYGNNDERADKYAVWYMDECYCLYEKYRTPSGGKIYVAMASNIANIPSGKVVAATPDGRKAHEPLSDAASPMHGMDKRGPTATILSTSKPDYTKACCGTVLNQKYSPSVFADDEKRAKLAALIRVYFARGGQEIQINSVSREVLKDAMEHPENYQSLVVRVSGFSALYITLSKEVQEDILKRTEHV